MFQIISAIVLRRLLLAIPTLLLLSMVVFVVLRMLPVDPENPDAICPGR